MSTFVSDVKWLNFMLGLNFVSFCFKLIIIDYHTPKQRAIKFEPKIKLNYNTPRIMDKSLRVNLQFVGLTLNYTFLTPNPYPANNVRRVYSDFFNTA